MQPLHAILLAFTSLAVSACNGGAAHGVGATTTGVGTTTSSTTGGGTTTSMSCPEAPLECGDGLPPCPQGSYCYSVDPCGDLTTCVPFPPACATSPTCACLVDAGTQDLGSYFECDGSGTSVYAYNNGGATECCP